MGACERLRSLKESDATEGLNIISEETGIILRAFPQSKLQAPNRFHGEFHLRN